MPIQNEHVYHLTEPSYENRIDESLLEELIRAKDSIFGEMSNDLAHITISDDVRACNLNRSSVTKAKLCGWLETVFQVFDYYSVPHLHFAVKRVGELEQRVEDLKVERDNDQKKIIELQNKLIEKRDEEIESLRSTAQEEIKSVQSTVKSQLQSYSSVLTKTCSAALAPKKIRAAVRTVADKEDRSRNLMLYGISEPGDGQEVLSDRVSEVLLEIGEKPVVSNCCRVGLVNNNTPRPVKLSCSSSDIVTQVLRKAKLLRTKEGYDSVYISPDRTVDERRAYKKLWEEVKEKRKTEPGKVHVIRNNKVVSFEKNSLPAPSGNI